MEKSPRKREEAHDIMSCIKMYTNYPPIKYPCYAMLYAIRSSTMLCPMSAVMKTLLRLDLAVSLDGDLVVGLERGDSVAGDIGAGRCQQGTRSIKT